MRIALLGPVGEHPSRLETAAAVCFSRLACDAAFYLGDEPEVLQFLERRRHAFEGEGVDELWSDCERCLTAEPDEITRLVDEQRAKHGLLHLSLLHEGRRRFHPPSGVRWLLCRSLDDLPDYERQWPRVVAHGDAEAWCANDADAQLVLCPGRAPDFGLLVLSDGNGPEYPSLSIEVYDERGERVAELEQALNPRSAAADS